MRISKYLLNTLKETHSDVDAISHALALRAGIVRQISSGIYSFLPLGLKVLQRISHIVKDYMDHTSLEMLMPCIQPADLWKKSGRYNDYGQEMLRMQDRSGRDMLFGPTHEELITHIISNAVSSYKQLPLNVYQIQWKFRDELRPRFGLMRCREFLMKDAYSFDIDANSSSASYQTMFDTYIKIFSSLSLKVIPVAANTGPMGGTMSHEFHVLSDTGESTIYYDKAIDHFDNPNDILKNNVYAVSDEMHNPNTCSISTQNLKIKKGIEVAHMFQLGTKYSKTMNASVHTRGGTTSHLHMGCYGIGISRLLAAIIEANHDDFGIIWPESIAPFKYGIINLNTKCETCNNISDTLHTACDALYDDTSDRPGEKFARMDLIGLPYQIIIGTKTSQNNVIEIKNRSTNIKHLISIEDFLLSQQ